MKHIQYLRFYNVYVFRLVSQTVVALEGFSLFWRKGECITAFAAVAVEVAIEVAVE